MIFSSDQPKEVKEPEVTPLDDVKIDGLHVEIADDLDAGEAVNEEAYSKVERAWAKLYTDEDFARHICGLLAWRGRVKGLDSLQNLEADERFKMGLDVIYQRLVLRFGDKALKILGNHGMEDLIICTVAFAPVVQNVAREVNEKKRAVVKGGEFKEEPKETKDD